MIKILLAEDDENLGTLLCEYFHARGYQATLATDGIKAYDAFMKDKFDVCVFDVMMPQKDGFSLAKDVRKINSEIPILFLTAKSMHEDVVEGFNTGADDYIKKPFSMEELILRIEAILRRSRKEESQEKHIFQLGRYQFDSNKRLLTFEGEVNKLTTKESELLKLLVDHKNDVLERNLALKKIWHDDTYFNARSMDVYITKLRKLLSKEPSIEIINIHSKGFKLIF